MKRLSVILFFGFLASTVQQKDPDEGKPYEFGFTIDGQQHRHEKKDIRGIIEGEFGFITADGIYHVTVYATDENGNFKILSMKNIRISAPLDGSPFKGEISPEANKYRKQANLPPLPSPQASPNPLAIPEASTQLAIATSSREPVKFTTQPTIKPACAGCGYITTQKPQPGQPLLQFTKPTFDQGQQAKPQQTFGTQNGQISPIYYENTAGGLEPPGAANYYQGNQQSVPSEQIGGSNGGFVPQNEQNSQNYIGGLTSSGQYENTAGISDSQNTGIPGSSGQPQNIPQQVNGVEPGYGTDQGGEGVVSQLPPGLTSSGQYENTAGISESQNTGIPGLNGQPQSNLQQVNGIEPGYGTDQGGEGVVSQLPPGSQGAQPQYQAASGPQSTGYKPFGGLQGGQPSSSGGGSTAGFGGGQGTGGATGDNVGFGNLGGSGVAPYGGGVANGGFGGQPNIGGGLNQPASPQAVGGSEQGGVPNFEQLGFPQANPLQINGQRPEPQFSSLPPISVSNGVIHVGGDHEQDIPIRDKFPGMQEGLPEGIEEKDITNLLYKFHYTVGFHGHYEKGLKNGAKIGGYFVNGRDGISRVVTYVADENGYRPKVRFINIGLESEDTPKPETEKKFGLKSFEFVWYPI